MNEKLNRLISAVKEAKAANAEHTHVVVMLGEESIAFRAQTKSACNCMAMILKECPVKVMPIDEFIETLEKVAKEEECAHPV